MAGFAFGEPVVILAPGTAEDEYGNEVEDWSSPVEVATIQGVGVEPRPVGETFTEDRNAVTSGFTLYLPAGSTVSPTQRIRVRGSEWAVLGAPAEWRNPFTGWEPGVVVQVGRTDG
jgi:hypothetical protein